MPGINSEQETKLKIGGITISFISCGDNSAVRTDDIYRDFITNHEPDVTLQVHYGQIPKSKSEKDIFDAGTTWSMFQSNGKYILEDTNRIAILEPDFKCGKIYTKESRGKTILPLSYPLDEVLMINLLAKAQGILIHACGVISKGQGLLFAGSGGVGKSTMASLWKKAPAPDHRSQGQRANILSDDRIIIRKMDRRFWVYGTPWHGDAKVCSPEKAPLEKIFFLKHAKNNTTKKIAPMEATSRLIVCSFPTFWNKKGMEFTLKFCAELAEKVSCYELGFVPDESILEFVRT
ncbi:MAG: hypothetical protein U9R01_05945 [candidate division WOR-3 bacterium]|nr:hypothetical protein [candidate division WOR-3 bacterium]